MVYSTRTVRTVAYYATEAITMNHKEDNGKKTNETAFCIIAPIPKLLLYVQQYITWKQVDGTEI